MYLSSPNSLVCLGSVYDQLCPVYAESLKPERTMVFPSPGQWGNSVRLVLLSGPWLGTGLDGCTIQRDGSSGCKVESAAWGAFVDGYHSLSQPGCFSQSHSGVSYLDSSI